MRQPSPVASPCPSPAKWCIQSKCQYGQNLETLGLNHLLFAKHHASMAQMVKRLSTMWETRVRSLGREDPLEKEMAIHSSTITWKIPWTEEPGRLQPMGSRRVGHNWVTLPYLTELYWGQIHTPSSSFMSSHSHSLLPPRDSHTCMGTTLPLKWISNHHTSLVLHLLGHKPYSRHILI